jgi:hypothetical protein
VADIGQIRSARTPAAVSAAATTAESDVYSDFYRLVGMTPPSALQAARDALVPALRIFRSVLTSTGPAADSGEVCADCTTEPITLNRVFAGNVTASKVPADKFPAS